MLHRRIPEWVRHAPTPSAVGFGVLAALDAGARGLLLSVFPLALYRALGDAELISRVFLMIGVASLAMALLTPWCIRHVPRRFMFTFGAGLYVVSAATAIATDLDAIAVVLLMSTLATVIVFVCFNTYVLDFVAQVELVKCETLRLFFAATSWCVGPALGVWLYSYWPTLPFLLSGLFGLTLLVVFWWMRLGDGKLIRRATAPPPNPIAFLGRFFSQPRLVAGWLMAVVRSTGWWVFVVYLPIFAIENGLGDRLGGLVLSVTNGFLFAAPVMLIWVRRHSVRHAVRVGFLMSGILFVAATLTADLPWLAVLALFAGSLFLILLDISAGLPFLMAVKPSERTEMSAVYSSFRDVSAILAPLLASAVLLVGPVSLVFAAEGLCLFLAWALAGRLHPRLGSRRAALGPAAPAVDAGA